jgi:class 3 adenylate cyclase
MFSFLKIIAKINKNKCITDYNKNLQMNERVEGGYRVRMGFGLHQGWAIEGAIGSYFKIDASYLSPNVNLASRLEAATKQYQVPILISGNLQSIFNERVGQFCREIDIVTVKGSIKPIKLFTIDLNLNLEPFEEKNYTTK